MIMNWTGCKYKSIAEKICDADIDKIINVMIDNCDRNGFYYETHKAKELLTQIISIDVVNYISAKARQEIENEGCENLDPFFFTDSQYKEIAIGDREDFICQTILNRIKSVAEQEREKRKFYRINVGEKVDFDSCVSYASIGSKIEFYKDGGWGIAEVDGMVVVKNHLITQPSKLSYDKLFKTKGNHCYIIKDRDTELLGILSLDTFKEVIHCLYSKIMIIESFYGASPQYFIKVQKDNKFGCYDDKFAIIIECKYDDIYIKDEYIECIYEGEELIYDTLEGKGYDFIIDGKKDLYNTSGKLLIGGYSFSNIEYGYLQIYFGTRYENYYVEELDLYNQPYQLSKLRLNYDYSLCLILDKKFRSLIQGNEGSFCLPIGIVFNSFEDVLKIIPSNYLFRYRVDTNHLYRGYIYLYNNYGEQYFIPHYIIEGFNSPEELETYEIQKRIEFNKSIKELIEILGDNGTQVTQEEHMSPTSDSSALLSDSSINHQDMFIDDSIVIIIKLKENHAIEWINSVNEIGISNYNNFIFRKGEKYGFYNYKGLGKTIYDAITTETQDAKIYVAIIHYCQDTNTSNTNNPNYISWIQMCIQYYIVENDEALVRLEDDWNIFNPTKYKWFPSNFIERLYGTESETMSFDDRDDGYNGYEWTDEDAWDAMTDGMYGDYPGSGWDPEHFGY